MSKFRDMFLLLFVTVLLAVVGADQDMAMDKSRVKIVSDSGEIQFQRQLGDASTLTDPVKIKMAQVVQVDAAGTEVATCSKLPSAPQIPMKKFNGFAGKAFNIEGMRNAQALPNAGSMKASMTKFAADLGADVGKMSIDLALAEDAGEVSIAGEKQALKKGDMKFNMELSEWNWCGTAGQSGAAAFLDVYIEVTSKQQPTMDSDRSATAPASFQLGDGMKISFSGKVNKDSSNEWTDMESGYPKIDPQNANRFIVRFPRFDTKVVYDPTVSAEDATQESFKDMAMDKSRVKIVSDSGEIQFQRQLGDASTLTDPVKIKMAQVVQVDAAGTEVATCSKLPSAPQIPMKKFNGFAGKAFNIEAMRNAQALPNAGSMKASMTKFAADLGADVGKMSIDLALAEEAGEVSIAGEKQALKKGDMKFNIGLSEWNWCGTAGQSGAAAFLDVYIEVTSKKQPTMDSDRNATAPASFQLGDGMKMSFSGKVNKDSSNEWTDMESGYPKIDPQNANRFIVRFPRFDTKVVYDPTVFAEDATQESFKDMAMDKSRVKIVSDSGEIQFQRQLGDASTLTDPVKIKMAQVVQVDAAGTEVATCSKLPSAPQIPMKKFNGFAGKAFNIEAMRNAQAVPNAGSMKASMTKFAADLGADVGKMSIDLALAEDAGEVSIAEEKQTLKKGDMKFNMELSEWNWCGTAGESGAAAFLDVYIEVKGKKTPTLKRARSATAPASFDLGDNMTMSFSGKVKIDTGNWTSMPDNYPKQDTQDTTRFIVRFPRFTDKIIYDPTVAGDDDDSSPEDSAASGLHVSAIVIALATAMVCLIL